MLLTAVLRRGEHSALIDGPEHASYTALAARSLSVARELAGAGIEPGQRVAIMLRRGAGSAAAYFGALAAGAVAVVVNETLRPRQIEHILGHAGVRVLVSDADILARLPRPLETRAAIVDIGSVPGSATSTPGAPRSGAIVAQIIYTSGSTGLPKGVTSLHTRISGPGCMRCSPTSASPRATGSRACCRSASTTDSTSCSARSATGATLVVERSPVPHADRGARFARTRSRVLAAVPPLWLQLLNVGGLPRGAPTDRCAS